MRAQVWYGLVSATNQEAEREIQSLRSDQAGALGSNP
jgi:hypothetical protein